MSFFNLANVICDIIKKFSILWQFENFIMSKSKFKFIGKYPVVIPSTHFVLVSRMNRSYEMTRGWGKVGNVFTEKGQ